MSLKPINKKRNKEEKKKKITWFSENDPKSFIYTYTVGTVYIFQKLD